MASHYLIEKLKNTSRYVRPLLRVHMLLRFVSLSLLLSLSLSSSAAAITCHPFEIGFDIADLEKLLLCRVGLYFQNKMASVSSLWADYQGVFCPTIGVIHPKLQLPIRCHNWSISKGHHGIRVAPGRIRNHKFQHVFGKKYTSYVGRNHQHLTFHDDYDQEPFWPHLLNETFRAIRSLLGFLMEQPSQLKYIEWPSFQSTLKTATLTLLLVGLLIIALSSVDSALCYILSLILRRRP